MEFVHLPEFDKELRKLLKKFRTLNEDLETLKKILKVGPHPNPPHTVQISGIGLEHPLVIKVKTFACKALKGKGGRSGIRVIFAYFPEEQRIEFIEIYYKGAKEIEDRNRILKHYAGQNDIL